MLRNALFIAAVGLTLTACSSTTHNLSKGVCRDIPTCQGGKCASKTDKMTQNHCEMLGGTFEPVNHQERWYTF